MARLIFNLMLLLLLLFINFECIKSAFVDDQDEEREEYLSANEVKAEIHNRKNPRGPEI